jgi:hypothetical protein
VAGLLGHTWSKLSESTIKGLADRDGYVRLADIDEACYQNLTEGACGWGVTSPDYIDADYADGVVGGSTAGGGLSWEVSSLGREDVFTGAELEITARSAGLIDRARTVLRMDADGVWTVSVAPESCLDVRDDPSEGGRYIDRLQRIVEAIVANQSINVGHELAGSSSLEDALANFRVAQKKLRDPLGYAWNPWRDVAHYLAGRVGTSLSDEATFWQRHGQPSGYENIAVEYYTVDGVRHEGTYAWNMVGTLTETSGETRKWATADYYQGDADDIVRVAAWRVISPPAWLGHGKFSHV